MPETNTPTPTSNYNFTGSIVENYLSESWIAQLTDAGVAPKWLYLGDGITAITPKYTDKKKTAAYYNGGGSEKPTVTGVTASYDVTGDRSYHNPAQDLIANAKFKTGNRRQFLFRHNEYSQNPDGSLTLTKSETGIAAFTDIDDGGGNADDNGGFKVTIQYIATPNVVGEKQADALNAILMQTPCQNASILHVDLKQPMADGTVKKYSADALSDLTQGNIANSRPASLDEARDIAQEAPDVGTSNDKIVDGDGTGNPK